MVQFGLYLRSFRYEPWGDHYLSYEDLKNTLYEIRDLLSPSPAPSPPPSPKAASSVKQLKRILDPKLLHQEFLKCLDDNLNKINTFYVDTKAEIQQELKEVHQSAENKSKEVEFLKKKLEYCYSHLVILKDFASLNYTGFAKLLKKHDKMLKEYFEKLRATYIRDKVNQQPVFGILDDIYRLQVETQVILLC